MHLPRYSSLLDGVMMVVGRPIRLTAGDGVTSSRSRLALCASFLLLCLHETMAQESSTNEWPETTPSPMSSELEDESGSDVRGGLIVGGVLVGVFCMCCVTCKLRIRGGLSSPPSPSKDEQALKGVKRAHKRYTVMQASSTGTTGDAESFNVDGVSDGHGYGYGPADGRGNRHGDVKGNKSGYDGTGWDDVDEEQGLGSRGTKSRARGTASVPPWAVAPEAVAPRPPIGEGDGGRHAAQKKARGGRHRIKDIHCPPTPPWGREMSDEEPSFAESAGFADEERGRRRDGGVDEDRRQQSLSKTKLEMSGKGMDGHKRLDHGNNLDEDEDEDDDDKNGTRRRSVGNTHSISDSNNSCNSRNRSVRSSEYDSGSSKSSLIVATAGKLMYSSVIPGVKEAATVIGDLVRKALEHGNDAKEGERRVGWCRSMVVTLDRAEKIVRQDKKEDSKGEGIVAEDVQESVQIMLQIMQAFKSKNMMSKTFSSGLCRRRQEEVETAITWAIHRVQLAKLSRVGDSGEPEPPETEEAKQLQRRVAEEKSIAYQKKQKRQQVDQVEISPEQVDITDEVIGKGGFSTVYLSDLNGLNAAAKVVVFDAELSEDEYSNGDDSGGDDSDDAESADRGGGGERRRDVRRAARAKKDAADRRQRRAFIQEVEAMKRLRGPHTVHIYGGITAYPDRLVLVTELLPGGDLRHRLRKARKPLKDGVLRGIVRDICSGMAFLHAQETVHGNLKSTNILFDGSGRAKIADFRSSFWTQHAVRLAATKPQDAVGTSLPWAAPELLSRQGASYKTDVYSFAMVLWECLTRKVPWGDATGVDVLMLAVLQGDRPPVPEDAPGDLRSLVESCWAQDPTDRPTLQKVLEGLEGKAGSSSSKDNDSSATMSIDASPNDDQGREVELVGSLVTGNSGGDGGGGRRGSGRRGSGRRGSGSRASVGTSSNQDRGLELVGNLATEDMDHVVHTSGTWHRRDSCSASAAGDSEDGSGRGRNRNRDDLVFAAVEDHGDGDDAGGVDDVCAGAGGRGGVHADEGDGNTKGAAVSATVGTMDTTASSRAVDSSRGDWFVSTKTSASTDFLTGTATAPSSAAVDLVPAAVGAVEATASSRGLDSRSGDRFASTRTTPSADFLTGTETTPSSATVGLAEEPVGAPTRSAAAGTPKTSSTADDRPPRTTVTRTSSTSSNKGTFFRSKHKEGGGGSRRRIKTFNPDTVSGEVLVVYDDEDYSAQHRTRRRIKTFNPDTVSGEVLVVHGDDDYNSQHRMERRIKTSNPDSVFEEVPVVHDDEDGRTQHRMGRRIKTFDPSLVSGEVLVVYDDEITDGNTRRSKIDGEREVSPPTANDDVTTQNRAKKRATDEDRRESSAVEKTSRPTTAAPSLTKTRSNSGRIKTGSDTATRARTSSKRKIKRSNPQSLPGAVVLSEDNAQRPRRREEKRTRIDRPAPRSEHLV